MTRDVATLRPDDAAAEAARWVPDFALPVCDAAGTLLGMLSRGDLLQPIFNNRGAAYGSRLALLEKNAGTGAAHAGYPSAAIGLVGDLMTNVVVSATEETCIDNVAELLVRHRIKRVPIVRDGRLVGIVSRADAIRAIMTCMGSSHALSKILP